VVGSAADEETAARLELARSQYEGPTGITGVLHDAANRSGLPSVSLWAAVPHYLPSAPNPKAALALVRRVAALLHVPLETEPLAQAAVQWEQGVTQLLESSEELGEYVQRLEAAADQGAGIGGEESIPSGEAIADEVERFLRDQRPGAP
jgi:predicted ATP-grasp superfamily ATP-dependent carboligase